ncbi:hypothetical protein BJ322DRAFT_1023248 [Thelephora terrestris]|uniref:Uncharacterized protein n=1 Tax=Thelephora terrestris TaxID=56493 RepID=A0A9P6HAH2_9AGAM|nr:hypothetical protein BJ322DRAFT_1023248 [Thelephora terrestris]
MRSSPSTYAVALILQFVIHPQCVLAVNLGACCGKLQGPPPPNITDLPPGPGPPPLNVSYEQCLMVCGAGMGDVNWQDFSQNFGAWFLPWISLMFQIPFGAEQPLDDALSFFITMGTPALAAYSLQITHLNKYWIHREFLDVKYANSKLIPTALAAFHHIPVRIEHQPPFLHSLIVLPENDAFWSHLAAANKTRRWSVPLVMSYILVIFSVILTTIGPLTSPPGSTGYSIAAVWTFLLPLVIGWLHVGCEPEPSHLRKSLEAANQKSWVSTGCRDHPTPTNIMAIEFAKADAVASRMSSSRCRCSIMREPSPPLWLRKWSWG